MAVGGRAAPSARWCRSRTRSRARSTRRSTRSCSRPTRSRSSARSCIRSATRLIARDAAAAGADRAGPVPSPGKRPVRPLPARAPERTRRWCGAPEHRRRGADRGRVRPALGRARQPHLRPSCTAARCWPTASRTRRRTRRASSGWRAQPANRPTADGDRPRSRPRSSSGACPTTPARWSTSSRSSPTRGINLSKIESRPRKQGLGRYVFFADLEGRADDPPVVDALAAVEAIGRDAARARVLSERLSRRAPERAGYTFRRAQWKPRPHSSHAGGARRARPGDGPGRCEPAGDPAGAAAGAPAPRSDGGRVLVLNASYEPLNVCTVRRAVVLVLKEKAELRRDRRARRALRERHAAASGRDPARDLRERAARPAPPAHHPARRVRARLLDLPVLRHRRPPDRGPRDPAQPRRPERAGRTSSPRAHPATAARATARRSRRGMHPRQKPRAPGPTVFIRVAAPVVPTAWQQYLI